jgi:hypothetical protein
MTSFPSCLPQGTAVPGLPAVESALAIDLVDVAARCGAAAGLGLLLALVYRRTHRGLSYSQSFTQTIVYIAVIVTLVMLTVRNSLATAFTLVGALSIIRFRTVVKDTRDTAFVFASLAIGMASGLGYLDLALLGTGVVTALAFAFHVTNFGAVQRSEFVLRLTFDQAQASSGYLDVLAEHARRSSLLHVEPSNDGGALRLSYDIALRKERSAEAMVASLGRVAGVSEVVLLVGKSDVDH